jgi:6-pyruvoyltetrahydropterin/6-carboxytetrahydropterin synthase
METILVRGRFHTGHRQLRHEGKCRFPHGHTWRGEFTLTAERFPRDDLDMSIDFGALKAIFKHLDHKFLVTADDAELLDAQRFDPEGLVLLPGRGPSVENVAHYCLERLVAVIEDKYPEMGVTYRLTVRIEETENNVFMVDEERVI